MSKQTEKRYHVILLQAPVLTNDLGEMGETELYNFLRTKIDAIAVERLMSQLHNKRTAFAEFTTPAGLKTQLEITAV
jgi:hypothetical protein